MPRVSRSHELVTTDDTPTLTISLHLEPDEVGDLRVSIDAMDHEGNHTLMGTRFAVGALENHVRSGLETGTERIARQLDVDYHWVVEQDRLDLYVTGVAQHEVTWHLNLSGFVELMEGRIPLRMTDQQVVPGDRRTQGPPHPRTRVQYLTKDWTRGAAWKHLQQHRPSIRIGDTTWVPHIPTGNLPPAKKNPYRTAHQTHYWAWTVTQWVELGGDGVEVPKTWHSLIASDSQDWITEET